MTQSGFIAVIDLGSSEIKCVVARRNENNVFSILESKTIESGNSVRRGLIYNIEETGASVRKLITMIENSIGQKIAKVYVSLNGQSLHSYEYRRTEQLSSSGLVSQEVVRQLQASADKHLPDMKRNYKVADVEYYVDDKPEQNPIGVTGSKIEAAFQLIVGRPNIFSNIEKSFDGKVKLPIAGYIIGALASAKIALTDQEKELGCAFVDFGAATTTLSIYKGAVLRRMVVIPFGGKNITKDICALNFTEKDAEQLKKKYGEAIEKKESSFLTSPFKAKADIDFTELNRVIGLRLDEITANLNEQIKLSGYIDDLGEGLIITGGASQLKNLPEYLSQKLKMPVRMATARKTFINNASELINNPSFTQVLGMLLLGQESCAVEERPSDDKESHSAQPEETKKSSNERKKRKQGLKTWIESTFEEMFSDEDE